MMPQGKEFNVFGGHIWELAIVLILALVVFGPKRLPEIGGAMGKGIKEFKKGTQDLQDRFDASSTDDDERVRTTQPKPVDHSRIVQSADEVPPRPTPVDREAG